eukprot:jgi/Antlo1/1520/405
MNQCIRDCVMANIKSNKQSIWDKISRRGVVETVGKKCHYKCSVSMNVRHIKFNNKYPFQPIFGGDEFFSALFSFGNLLSSAISYYLIASNIKGNSDLAKLNRLAIRSNILTWVFSTIYHYHVCRVTRDLDYFFAFLTILMNFYIFLLRLLYVHRQKESVEKIHRRLRALVVSIYVFHVYNMYFVEFNFKIHKNISSIFIGISVLIWFYLARTFKQLPHSRYLLVFAAGVCISGVIEMCDMPPLYYLLDSHAIYHLITIFLHPLYYLFIKYDMEHLTDTQKTQ